MKKFLLLSVFTLSIAFSAQPAIAQESLFSVEQPSALAPLVPLDPKDMRTARFVQAWNRFIDAMMVHDKSALGDMLGAGSPAITEAELARTSGFILAHNNSPFAISRMFASISSRSYPSRSMVLGWQAPASLSMEDRAAIMARPGGEAVGCYCTGPDCNAAAVSTAADTTNTRLSGFACARMIMATDGAIRFEVAVPDTYIATPLLRFDSNF